MPIGLTKDQRGSWASSPSEMSTFLVNIAEFAIEIIAPKKLKDLDSKHAKIFSQASEKIFRYISAENFKLMALSGAYFRHIKSQVVDWSGEDEKELTTLLAPYLNGFTGSQYLASFSTNGKNASEAHCAFLRAILFPDLEILTKEEHGGKLDTLLTSAIKVIDFLTTPYAVLFEEAGSEKKTTSGLDLQWSSMQKAVKRSVDELIEIKPKSSLLPQLNLKPVRSKIIIQKEKIETSLLIFQGSLGIENIRLEMLERYNKLQNEFKDLKKKYDDLESYICQIDPTPGTFTPKQRIQNYGKRWEVSYAKAKKENFKASLDEALIEVGELRQQLLEKETEIQQWMEKSSQQEKVIAQMKAEQDQLREENNRLKAKADELDTSQSLITTENNPNKLPFINWIKHLLVQITQLTQSNEQLNKEIASLQHKNKKLTEENQSLQKPFKLEIGEPSSLPPPVLSDNVDASLPSLGTWAELLRSHCLGTNSTGMKEIMAEANQLLQEKMNETEKLSCLSIKMRQIASERKDSSWSKSHFFGKGRHSGIQKLYDLMAENGFSLHTKGYCDRLKDLLSKENFIHQENQGNEETQNLLFQ